MLVGFRISFALLGLTGDFAGLRNGDATFEIERRTAEAGCTSRNAGFARSNERDSSGVGVYPAAFSFLSVFVGSGMIDTDLTDLHFFIKHTWYGGSCLFANSIEREGRTAGRLIYLA